MQEIGRADGPKEQTSYLYDNGKYLTLSIDKPGIREDIYIWKRMTQGNLVIGWTLYLCAENFEYDEDYGFQDVWFFVDDTKKDILSQNYQKYPPTDPNLWNDNSREDIFDAMSSIISNANN
jgi:hypothetical protein